jgi:hypothetical protein
MHINIPSALRLKITPVAPIVNKIPESAKYVAKLGSINFQFKVQGLMFKVCFAADK